MPRTRRSSPMACRPVVVDLGSVRDVTLGSSTSGTADANSQYYW
ncbi:lasso RiPP family leader peptide-containing protein [Streptomyces niveus]